MGGRRAHSEPATERADWIELAWFNLGCCVVGLAVIAVPWANVGGASRSGAGLANLFLSLELPPSAGAAYALGLSWYAIPLTVLLAWTAQFLSPTPRVGLTCKLIASGMLAAAVVFFLATQSMGVVDIGIGPLVALVGAAIAATAGFASAARRVVAGSDDRACDDEAQQRGDHEGGGGDAGERPVEPRAIAGGR